MFQPRAITAADLAARGPRGPIFGGVDIDLAEGGLGVIVGPGGSGRTTLLLTLAGRFTFSSGRLRVAGHRLPDDPVAVRKLVAVARARPAVELDDGPLGSPGCDLTGRRALGGLPHAFDLVGLSLAEPRTVEGRELRPVDRTLLALALALTERPHIAVIDDVDDGADEDDLARVWQALLRVTSAGTTVVASAAVPPPRALLAPGRDTVVALPGVPVGSF